MTTADILRELSERLDRADKQFTDAALQQSADDDVLKSLKTKGKAEGVRLAKGYVDEALREVTS